MVTFRARNRTVSNRRLSPRSRPWPVGPHLSVAFAPVCPWWITLFHPSPSDSTDSVRPLPRGCTLLAPLHTNARLFSGLPRDGYELFNCSSLRKRYQWWNYRGCWHHALPLVALWFYINHRPSPVKQSGIFLRCLVQNAHWASSAPAAFLRTVSRLSCSLSGVEPESPVRVISKGRLYLPYKMMRQMPIVPP